MPVTRRPRRYWPSTRRSASGTATRCEVALRCSRRQPPRPSGLEHWHAHRHRRPVRRDQGSAGRLLPGRGRRPGSKPLRLLGRCPHRSAGSRYGPSGVRLIVAADPADAAVVAAVAEAHRREWAFVLAATVRVTRDLDLAEECVQERVRAGATDLGGARSPHVARGLAHDRGPPTGG